MSGHCGIEIHLLGGGMLANRAAATIVCGTDTEMYPSEVCANGCLHGMFRRCMAAHVPGVISGLVSGKETAGSVVTADGAHPKRGHDRVTRSLGNVTMPVFSLYE